MKKKKQMKGSCSGGAVSGMDAKFKKMQMKGSCSGGGGGGGVSGMDDKFKRKVMKRSCGGVGLMSAEFERGFKPDIHPLLRVGWSVMVIDDHNPKSRFQFLDRIHLLFFYSEFEVNICTQPSQALSLLKRNKNRVDFVICNIHMKGMDEATLFELVGLKDVLVIMMSTYMDTRLVIQGMNHGACLFVLKPQSWEDVQNISSLIVEKKKYPSKLPWKLHKKFDEVVDQLGVLMKRFLKR